MWSLVLLVVLPLIHAAKFEITNVYWSDTTAYSTASQTRYTSVVFDFLVTEGPILGVTDVSSGTGIGFEVVMPTTGFEMLIGEQGLQMFPEYPGKDLGWVLQEDHFPGLTAWIGQGTINGTAFGGTFTPLPTGYVGKVTIDDVSKPTSCIHPGTYQLTIGTLTATFLAAHQGVMCPEFVNLAVELSADSYDAVDVYSQWSFEIAHFPWADTGYLMTVEFPPGAYPQVHVIDSVANVTGYGDSFAFDPTSQENITSLTDGTKHTPSWVKRTVGNDTLFTLPVGTQVNFTFGPVRNPWSCAEIGEYCVSIGPFKACTDLTSEIRHCPEITALDLDFSPSRYGSEEASAEFQFTVLNYPLYEKSKYYVTLNFPPDADFDLAHSFLTRLPEGQKNLTGPDVVQEFRPLRGDYTVVRTTTEHYVRFRLMGNTLYTPNGNTTFLAAGSTDLNVTLSNITLPSYCSQLGNYSIMIGPWGSSADLDDEVTGCSNLTNLDLTFSDHEQGATNVTAFFRFDLGEAELHPDPVAITFEYNYGEGETFTVTSVAANSRYWSMNGQGNANLTVYRGESYDFDVWSPYHFFALMVTPSTLEVNGTTMAGQLLQDGVINNNITMGTVEWQVPLYGSDTYYYQDPANPYMLGTITLMDRPRGLTVTDDTWFGAGRFLYFNRSAYGTLFTGQTVHRGREWIQFDPPRHRFINDGSTGQRTNEIFAGFHTSIGSPVPIGPRKTLVVQNVNLPPGRCTDLGNFTLQIGQWSVSGNPESDDLKCPVFRNFEVDYSTHVMGSLGVTVTVTYDVYVASLRPYQVTFLFPPDAGFHLQPSARFVRIHHDWVPSPEPPIIVNIPGIEVSITQAVVSGSIIQPVMGNETDNRTTLIIDGVDLPMNENCDGDLGNYTLIIGDKFRHVANPLLDLLTCPNITNLDVFFTPNQNHSDLTNAVLSFNISDWMDPADIIIGFPVGLEIFQAKVIWAFEAGYAPGWVLGESWITRDIFPHIRQTVRYGRRVPAGRHTILISNVTLPRGNCSNLGEWYLRIGNIDTSEDPVSDTIEGCVGIEDLVVTFSPDAEQGRSGHNMTFHFTITDYALRYVPGNSDFISFYIPPEVGITVGYFSEFVNVMPAWVPDTPRIERLSDSSRKQPFLSGNLVPAESRVSFTVTDVTLPEFCIPEVAWSMSIGIWTIHAAPLNDTQLVLCPRMLNLNVEYQNNVQCSQLVDAKVTFDVEETRLRAGVVRFDLPPESGLVLWPFAYVVGGRGPGEWKAVDDATIVPIKCVNHPGDEISFTQRFIGPPLEVGTNYSFWIHGIGLPCNNCTDLGLYKLAADKWSTPWSNPIGDTLRCPGQITGINITLEEPNHPERQYPNATVAFRFTVHDCQVGNEIRIQLPYGWSASRIFPTAIIHSTGLDLTNANIWSEGRELQIRNVQFICGNNDITLYMTNIGLGNNCDEGSFKISTHTCGMLDRSAGQHPPIRRCWATQEDSVGKLVSSVPMPVGCDLCGACRVEMWDKQGDPVFECEHNANTFQRTIVPKHCAEPTMAPTPEY